MGKKSILEEILDDFTESVAENPFVGEKMAKKLREMIERGECKNKELISKLLREIGAGHENP